MVLGAAPADAEVHGDGEARDRMFMAGRVARPRGM